MCTFATVQDIIRRYGPMPVDEEMRAGELLDDVTSVLVYIAEMQGRDLRSEIESNKDFAKVARVVVVDIVKRALRQSTNGEPMSQESESALGYSWSGTYAIPGGGIAQAIMKNDLKRLGLRRQKIGVIEPYGTY